MPLYLSFQLSLPFSYSAWIMNEVNFSVFFSSNAAGEILENKAEIKVGCLSCLLGHIDTHRDAFFSTSAPILGVLWCCSLYICWWDERPKRLSGFSVPIIRRAKLASYENQKGMGIRIKNHYVYSYSDIHMTHELGQNQATTLIYRFSRS